MGVMDKHAQRVIAGNVVEFRLTGTAMAPLIGHQQLVTVAPVDVSLVEVGDIVLVGGIGQVVLLRLVSGVEERRVRRVEVSNNQSHVLGWVNASYVYGICTAVDGVPRTGSAEKVLPPGVRRR
jgi:hypothetical protein